MNTKLSDERCVIGTTCDRVVADHIERYKFAARFVKAKRVLDIACGSGYGSSLLAISGAREVIGVDISKVAISYANSYYPRRNIRFIVSDLLAFQTTKKFDVVVCFETLEHIKHDKQALRLLHSSLRPNGILLISTPNRPVYSPENRLVTDKPHNKFHAREYAVYELITLLSSVGFKVFKDNIFGQRLRIFFDFPLLDKIYEALFNPNYRADARVKKVGLYSPRYIVIVAYK